MVVPCLPPLSLFAGHMNIICFEEPVISGYLYPCSLADIRACLARMPENDLQGLAAVGLVSVTRKDASAYARYFSNPKPTIHIHSFAETLSYKQPANTKKNAKSPCLS